ncbi:MAG TPA: NUDIX domain-containing protein [Planctomycetota bacterium]|nr:NUDIX domain-containing protein [Planctomycetota bacterium]
MASMDGLLHRVKVFVFTRSGEDVRYLFLRHRPKREAFWGPIEGPILPSEGLELAACRRVHDEIGIERPLALVDLRIAERWTLPQENVVEWAYGYGVEAGVEPRRLASGVSEWRWDGFDAAFRSMELDANREAILRLHLLLTS